MYEIEDMFDASGGRLRIPREVKVVLNDLLVDVLSIVNTGKKAGDAGEPSKPRQKRTARSAEMTPPEEKTLERKKAGRSKSKASRSKSRTRVAFNFSALDDDGDFVQKEEKKIMYKSSQEGPSQSIKQGQNLKSEVETVAVVKTSSGGAAVKKKKK